MYLSENDRRAESIREQSKEELIAEYERIIAENSDDGLAFLNVSGQEVPDPTIVDPPLGYTPAPDLMELMRRMIRNELSGVAAASEFETLEEADDFDIDDDPVDYSSPYEEYFDPPPGAVRGPPGQLHPARQDPNAPPATPPAGDPPEPPQAPENKS